MSDVEVNVEVPAEEPTDAIEDAIDHAIDVNLAEKVGVLEATVANLVEKVGSHSHPEYDHTHEYLASSEQVEAVEQKINEHIDSAEEEELEPEIPPVETESESESESEESHDEPPKSRQERKSIADMYYGK